MSYGNFKQTKTNYFTFFWVFSTVIGCLFMVNLTKEWAVANYVPEDASHYAVATVEEREIWTKPDNELIKPTVKLIKTERQTVRTEDNRPKEQDERWPKSVVILPEIWQNEVRDYLLDNSNDIEMVATFIAESWLRSWAVWGAWELGLCQVMPQYNPITKDKRWSDWKFQADYCISKWKVVPNKWKIWSAYRNWSYKKFIN